MVVVVDPVLMDVENAVDRLLGDVVVDTNDAVADIEDTTAVAGAVAAVSVTVVVTLANKEHVPSDAQ